MIPYFTLDHDQLFVRTYEQVTVTTTRETTTHKVKRLTYQYFGKDAPTALRVFKCESGLRPDAVGSTDDYGVAQIHLPAHSKKIPADDKIAWLFNPENNIKLAYQLFLSSGFNPWVCARTLGVI